MKRTIVLLTILLSIGMLSSCNGRYQAVEPTESGGSVTESEEVYDDGQTVAQVEDEDETATLTTQKVEDSFFVGTWVAKSEKAKHMYGNVTININEDGTWDGNITEEDVQGTWMHAGDGIRLNSDVIPFNMVFSDNNNVLLQETDDSVRVVLTRQ